MMTSLCRIGRLPILFSTARGSTMICSKDPTNSLVPGSRLIGKQSPRLALRKMGTEWEQWRDLATFKGLYGATRAL